MNIKKRCYLARVDAFADFASIFVGLETKLAVASARWWTPTRLVTFFLRQEVVLVTSASAVDKLLTFSRFAVEEPAREICKAQAWRGRKFAQRRKSRSLLCNRNALNDLKDIIISLHRGDTADEN